ncbi:ATPase [Treponema primitia ZAS-2]|uniref:ATPase n=1 Tax=Treponema primitia (strain ATCC BAA-887 / DSM 12427 / ZAS-2) TaxID=545694 RepID=F5YQX3_TREPZ|nr:ATP-binding protein [Treponema primitia]AEF84299.1 ATPase [Treponema primitia ZAS-2]
MSLLEQIIKESQARSLPAFTRRELRIELKGNLAPAIIGMRRSGKTCRLFQGMDQLIRQGINRAHILYCNFDDPRLRLAGGEGLLTELLETFFRLNPQARRQGAWLFFDEIQQIPGWAQFARRISDTEKVQLFLAGTSSQAFTEDAPPEFRGRSRSFELLPFSFRETLGHQNIPGSHPAHRPHPASGPYPAPGTPATENPATPADSPLERSDYEHLFSEYLIKGGFPDACAGNFVASSTGNFVASRTGNFQTKVDVTSGILEDHFTRAGLLQSYLDAVVLRDLLERRRLSNAPGVLELARTLVALNGTLVSMKGLADRLSARGLSMSREMTAQICAYLEDAFLIFLVPLYASSPQKTRVNPQKVYAVDPGLAWAHTPSPDQGRSLEQAVYLELRRRYPSLRQGGISYYLTRERRELNFLLGNPAQGPQALFQACPSLKDPETRKRELGALTAAMEELGLQEATVITLYEREELRTPWGIITVRPAWEWFLEG